MSSAPATALMSMLPVAPAQATDVAAPVETLDATQTSAFSRMLEAEASLAQAVATLPQEESTVSVFPEALNTESTEAADEVAVALAQAAHAGLAPLPATPIEETLELPETDLTTDVEPQHEDVESAETAVTTKSTILQITYAASSTDSRATEPVAKDQAVVKTAAAAQPDHAASEPVDPETIKNETAKVSVAPLNTTQKSENVEETDKQIPVHTTEAKKEIAKSPVRMPSETDAAPLAFTSVETKRSEKSETKDAAQHAVVRSADAEETESIDPLQAVAPEFLLGAAGVLNTMAPRASQTESAPDEQADETTSQVELISEDTSDSSSDFEPALTRTPKAAFAPSDEPQGEALEIESGEIAISERPASREKHQERVAAFAEELGEVRVISSQMSRKEVQPEKTVELDQKDSEILPMQAELSAKPVDKKGGEKVAEPALRTKIAEFAQMLSRDGGEKVARQSSPEGFSFDAGQREISASAVTVPSFDGGRPETIASRNSTPTNNPTPSSRTERLSGQILEAIPNPLRVTTFEIKPEGHGAIRVRISARGEGESAVWRVQIQTSDPAARSLLSEHLNDLRERLPAENVQVELRGAGDVRTEVAQRENGGSRERNGDQRQPRGEEQRQPKQQKSGNFLEWLKAQE